MRPFMLQTGVGIVTKTKKPGEHEITVFIQNDITDIEEDIVSFSGTLKDNHKDPKGNKGGGSVDRGVTVKAMYHNEQPHQFTSPDVVVGEQVALYQVGSDNRYWWGISGAKSNLRKLEHTQWRWSNKGDPTDDGELKKDNTYVMTVSTRDKKISLVTTDNDKEKATYKIEIDTKKGSIVIEDNHDNFIKLESPEKKVSVQTKLVYIDAPETHITGNVLIDGTLDVKKDTTLHKNLTVKSNTSTKGSNTTDGKTTGKGGFYSGSTEKKKTGSSHEHDGHIFPG